VPCDLQVRVFIRCRILWYSLEALTCYTEEKFLLLEGSLYQAVCPMGKRTLWLHRYVRDGVETTEVEITLVESLHGWGRGKQI
jgi:hypothetical protein